MAEAMNTLAGLVALNDQNLSGVEGISDLFDGTSLIEKIYAQTASQGGTLHSYLKQTVASGAAFRAINSGVTNAASQDQNVSVTLKALDASFHVDKLLADAYKTRNGAGYEAYLNRATARALRAALFAAETQIIGGTIGGDAAGFLGLANTTTMDKKNDTQVVDAGGTGSGTSKTSVYLIRAGMDAVSLVIGNDGKLSVSDPYLTLITDTTTHFDAYRVSVLGYLGLQLGSVYDSVRIANITNESTKGLTDAKIALALAKFPASRMPNMIVMNRYAQSQLQTSRTATTATGAPAPFPTEAFNIPIIVTDAIGNAEALLTT